MKHQQLSTTPEISKRMSKVKLKGNQIERKLARLLYARGYRYRLNYKKIPGSPDIAITKNRVAIFVDGSFWHGYEWEKRKKTLKSNREYWILKIEENRLRDKKINLRLSEMGWIVIRFWDFEVNANIESCLSKIEKTLGGGKTMSENQYKTMNEISNVVSESIGKTFRELDVSYRLNEEGNKGRIGHVIEEGLLKYAINNAQEPDIKNLMLEIKTAGYRFVRNRTMISAKERLVITMIDYMRDPHIDFYNSHLYKKIRNLLILLYEYKPDLQFGDYVLSDFLHYRFDCIPEVDQQIILQDYHKILEKIKNGYAHELSESDTNYLGACPKGANKHSLARQPRSNLRAMRRAFSLKSTYMTILLRNELQNPQVPRLIKSPEDIRGIGLDDYVLSLFKKYIGKSLSEIDGLLTEPISRRNKSYLADYAARMLKISLDDIDNIEEFNKANIKIKTIRLSRNGKIKESMSFPAFDFIELSKETWENARIRLMFQQTRFLFLIFKEIDDHKHEYLFTGVKFWNMPISTLNKDVKDVWLKTRWILNNQLEAKVRSNNSIESNFPGSSENRVMHVRPHGKTALDSSILPMSCSLIIENSSNSLRAKLFIDEHRFTKQCFWLNNEFILSIVSS